MSHRNVREYFINLRAHGKWNNLNGEVAETGFINTFKNRYDRAQVARSERGSGQFKKRNLEL